MQLLLPSDGWNEPVEHRSHGWSPTPALKRPGAHGEQPAPPADGSKPTPHPQTPLASGTRSLAHTAKPESQAMAASPSSNSIWRCPCVATVTSSSYTPSPTYSIGTDACAPAEVFI
eukprot:3843542-Prymnesium_polylepis.2